ncbi:CRISPR-associated protein Csx10 [Evansella caseinilytica]|uniref:CRISPR-associated protein Csx10 n=1 Tax=Evansella caseinilytica TaxID=1503961 RepID=A0A1H3SPF8_9BACI|nr:RAMP superfamily CRISPR-associated protein [Evansella caseinilytica]SDZ39558.1 CRISPR-associated protein Csx10 [Evansella caseinilytica]
MKEFELVITLLSDLSAGNGDSVAGLVDSDITHDYGLPIIPAKRIKGALHHVGKELVDWGLTDQSGLEAIFGSSGQADSGPAQFFDAILYKIPASFYRDEVDEKLSTKLDIEKELEIADYARLTQQLRMNSDIQDNDLLHLFTTVRSRTAIDLKTQAARKHSLRTMRVVHRGLTLKSKILLHTEDNESEKLLKMCVKGLRRLGLGRSRGLGEVACSIHRVNSSPTNWKSSVPRISKGNKEVEVMFRMTLEQPVMIAGKQGLYHSCESWIHGSTLLGAFAGMYITDHRLGENAHQDKDFSRIFLRDGVNFGYAYPEIDGKRFAPCPAHWHRVKNQNVAYDLSQEKTKKSDNSEEQVALRSIGEMAFLQGEDTLVLHDPEKEVRMHHSRPDDRGIGRALGEERTPEEENGEAVNGRRGQFFQYTALRQGQSFIGSVRGEQQYIDALIDCLKKRNGKMRLGRSRTAEYGNVSVEILNEVPPLLLGNRNIPRDRKKCVALCFVTPMLLRNQEGRPELEPTLLIAEMESALHIELKIEKKFLKHTTLSGFNGKWRMPKPQQVALDAGTVLIVSVENGKVNWHEVEKRPWGSNTGEGCGRLKVLDVSEKTKKMRIQQVQEIEENSPTVGLIKTNELDSELVDTLMKKINNERKKAEEAIQGREEAKELLEKLSEIKIGQTKLHQLYQLALKEADYDLVQRKEDGKDILVKIAESCEGRSLTFKEAFFQILKLEVRKGHG